MFCKWVVRIKTSFEEERREGGRILFRQFASFSLQLKQAKTVNALKRKTSSRYIVTDGQIFFANKVFIFKKYTVLIHNIIQSHPNMMARE